MRHIVCLVLVSLMGVAANAVAQSLSTAADLEVVVTDATGGRILGAFVEVVSNRTNGRRTLEPGAESGRYIAHALAVGDYSIVASATGFERRTVPGITLTLGSMTQVAVTLAVAGQQLTTNVEARPQLLNVQRPGLGGVVTRADFDQLPIDTRNPLAFSLLLPGTGLDRTAQQGASRTSGLVFSGQRARANSVSVDGLDINDQVVGSTRGGVGQGAVEELQVLANSFSAELGNASGGVVNVVTRAGTNQTRGRAFADLRDAALAARNYFERDTPSGVPANRPEAPFQQIQFGASLGGRVRRDRTFFFVNVERRSTDASSFVTIDDRTPVSHPLTGASLGSAIDILQRAGFPVTSGHVPYRLHLTDGLLRLDHDLTAAQRLTVRISGASELNENIEPFGGLVARSRGASLAATDAMVSVSHGWIPGSRTVNQVHLQVARRDQTTRALDPLCDGACDRVDEGGPTLEVIGTASVGRQRFTPTPRDDTQYEVRNTWSHAIPTHTIKAGGNLQIDIGRDQALPLHFGGRYIFSPLPAIAGVLPVPISAIQAVALGLPAAYVQGYGEPAFRYDTGGLSAFLEDVWTPRGDLSVRYGVRYQRQQWPDVSYRAPGLAPYGFPSDNDNVAPRFAVSWSPTSSIVVRGGYGVYYDNIITVSAGVPHSVSGQPDGIRTAVLPAPAAFAAWAAPGHRIAEAQAAQLAGGAFPSVVIALAPELKTSFSHQAFAGIDRRVAAGVTVSVTATFVRGRDQLGTIDYNPIVPSLGRGRRPGDVNGIAGTSASVLQYTSFGESWYRGVTAGVDLDYGARIA
jgi:hypothetical protein